MLELYRSYHCVLSEIRRSGKKQVCGVLCFEGLPSIYGSHKEVTALEDGLVLHSGFNYNKRSRESRRGMIITMMGREGVTVTYGRLAHRFVNAGDYVRAGQVIGIQGSTGTGSEEYLTMEFRRNGRRVDGCSYLGIPAKITEFMPPRLTPSQLVCRVCDIPDDMRMYIDNNPGAPELWAKLLTKLQSPSKSEHMRRQVHNM